MRFSGMMVVLGVMGSLGGVCSGAVIFEEHFDQYENMEDLDGVWNRASTSKLIEGKNGGKALFVEANTNSYSGNNSVKHVLSEAVKPTAGRYLKFSASIYDNGDANKRCTVGLRDSGVFIFEMGRYTGCRPYRVRLNEFPTQSSGWMNLSGEWQTAGWHQMTAYIGLDGIHIEVDLFSDGVLDGWRDFELEADAWDGKNGFSEVRLGGPSDVQSLGGGLGFDDVKLELLSVPEPGVAVMLGLGGLMLLSRKRG